jgi:O-methyltransferase
MPLRPFRQWRKQLQRAVLRRAGFEIHRTRSGGAYLQNLPYGFSTYCPWFEESFQELYAAISSHTSLKEDRAYLLRQLARHAAHFAGEFAECGVYKGGSAFLLARAIEENGGGKELHSFDTFRGMPAQADGDPSSHRAGDFGDVSLEGVAGFLRQFSFVALHPGLIPDTFHAVDDRRFAFVHVDVDLYAPARDCCRFFYERMTPGGLMVFDNYGRPDYELSERRAVDEFFDDRPESPIVLRSGQCLVMKL